MTANLTGRGWTALLYLALAPVYVDLMGVESYGLVGFFLSLFALSSIVELGLSSALNRELARYSARGKDPAGARDLVWTLEPIYWGLALLMGAVTFVAAPFITDEWFNEAQISPRTVEDALMLMALVLVVQWPLNLYSGGLLGLERHVSLNVILVVMVTVRMGGAAVALWLVEPTITVFFAWQAFAAMLHTGLARAWLWHALPRHGGARRFRWQLVASLWRFATGIGATSILVVLLTQLDKLVLSGLLTLEDFGYYSLAALLSSGISYLALPVFQAVFPRLSGLVALSHEAGIVALYHGASQLMAVLVLPVATVIALFSFEAVELWTGEAATAANTHEVAALLVAGTALNALTSVPYALQLAHGWTKLSFLLNFAAVMLFVPLLFIVTNRYGAVGAASLWLALNVGYIVVGVHLMHRRLLPSERHDWYIRDLALPGAAALAAGGAFRLTFPDPSSRFVTALWLLAALVCALGASVAVTPRPRTWLCQLLARPLPSLAGRAR